MAYVINKTNGQQLMILADGTLDTSTSLFLIGKNYPGYGELQQENFIRLLETGANNTAPVAPLVGQLWYDVSTSKLKIFDGSSFKSIGSAVSATAPTGAIAGDSWWDTANDQLKVYDGTTWQLVGPAYSKLDGRTGSLVEAIFDSTVTISGYPTIKPGYNYNNGTGNPFTISKSTSGSILITNSANVANIALQANVNGTITTVLNVNSSTGLITVINSPTNDLGIATKRYVDLSSSGVDTKLASNVAAINASLATLTANAAAQHNTLLSLESLKANIASPTLTGTPLSTTPSTEDESTRIATTSFVKSAIAAADNGLWKGSNKFVSVTAPTSGDGASGDIWFVI